MAKEFQKVYTVMLFFVLLWGSGCWFALVLSDSVQREHLSGTFWALFQFPFPATISWPVFALLASVWVFRRGRFMASLASNRGHREAAMYYTQNASHVGRKRTITTEATASTITLLIPHKKNQPTNETIPYTFSLSVLVFGSMLVAIPTTYSRLHDPISLGNTWLLRFTLFAPIVMAFFNLLFQLGYDRLGFRRVIFSPSENRLYIYTDIVWTFMMFWKFSILRYVSPLEQVDFTLDPQGFHLEMGKQPMLYIYLSQKKRALPLGYSLEEYQHVMAWLQQFLQAIRQNATVETVIFQ